MYFDNAYERVCWLKEQRINRGHTIKSLARELDVAEFTIKRLEVGERLSPPTAKKFADYYGVKVTDLFPVDEAA